VDFDAVADELFGLAPASFVERRNALAALALSDGDEHLAARIKSLRRPTVGAALVNALVRERADVMSSFLSLGAELRDAQARGDGQQIRELLGHRQELMRVMDSQAAELANERGLTATRAVLQDVHATMLAALSDPRAEAIVRAGCLESALNDATFADRPPAATSGLKKASRRIESARRKLDEANASAAAADDAIARLAAEVNEAQCALADLDRKLDEALEQARRIERDRSTADRKVTTARDAHASAVRRARALREAAADAKAAYDHQSAS
jgi:hypothetical protein